MNKYDFLENKINNLFIKLFDLEKHPFYSDLDKVTKISKIYTDYQKKIIKRNFVYKKPGYFNEIKNIKNKKYDFDLNLLKKLLIEINKSDNFKQILAIVSQIYHMNIPSNVRDINDLLNNYRKSDKIKIGIIGAGPIGLFLACYLNIYYNFSFGLNNQPKVDIIVFDNRIAKKGFKKPYNRYRPFAFNSGFFSYIFPKIYSWDKSQNNGLYINIFILEYALFTKAYYEYNIPFIFDDLSWKDYEKIIKKGKIDVIFDATGGRLDVPFFKSINDNWLNSISYDSRYPKLNINKNDNIVTLYRDKPKRDKKFALNYYYGSIIIYDNKFNILEKLDLDIINYSDFKLILSVKGKYFNYNNIKKIIQGVSDNLTRNFILNKLLKNNNTDIFQIDLFNTNIRHAIVISKALKIDNHNYLYIGAGDTIFHSHFITGSGLNRTINFAVKCANLLIYLSLK